MALNSLLETSQTPTSPKNKIFIPNLCDIEEDIVLESDSPGESIEKQFENELNPDAKEFTPVIEYKTDHDTITYKKSKKFTTKHTARAKLNIYISKVITKEILPTICELFPNTAALYYYLDVSTALQINDNQMYIFESVIDNQMHMVVFINFDLHKKTSSEIIYGVVLQNEENRIQNSKWLWKLDQFLTAKQINDKYGVIVNDLPKSSRLIHGLTKYMLNCEEKINANILYYIDWTNNNISIISQQVKKIKKFAVKLDVNVWIYDCFSSWNCMPAIPIIVYGNTDFNRFIFWIEWCKLIYIKSYQSLVGISFKKCDKKAWELQTIYLDKNVILNKHRLFGYVPSNYSKYFDKFNTSITNIQWCN